MSSALLVLQLPDMGALVVEQACAKFGKTAGSKGLVVLTPLKATASAAAAVGVVDKVMVMSSDDRGAVATAYISVYFVSWVLIEQTGLELLVCHVRSELEAIAATAVEAL